MTFRGEQGSGAAGAHRAVAVVHVDGLRVDEVCIGGGGQPYGVDNERRRQRIAGLYQDDRDQAVRCSHENPEVVRLYRDFLGQPNGQKAHESFHTRYTARPLYKR